MVQMGGEPMEPSTSLGEFMGLMEAASLDDLYRRLVLWPRARHNTWDAFEPWCIFHRFHEHAADGAATTAVLLVTDGRWASAAGRLMAQIANSELVPAEDLDLLAETFLSAGKQVFWEAPEEWFRGGTVIALEPEGPVVVDPPPPDEDKGLYVASREVWPPLRRWAAARLSGSNPARWPALVQRARELDSRGGAAVMRGVLDSVDVMEPKVRQVLLDLAAGWPNKGVREAATERLAPSSASDHTSSAPSKSDRRRHQGRSRPANRQPTLF
jgi:hypothetical protein